MCVSDNAKFMDKRQWDLFTSSNVSVSTKHVTWSRKFRLFQDGNE